MQLSRKGRSAGEKPRGFFATGAHIIRRESPIGLYKGLGAVVAGIVPKMAIRFWSFEQYKTCLLYTSPSPRDRQKARMPSSA